MELTGIGPSGVARLLVEIWRHQPVPEQGPLRLLERHRTHRTPKAAPTSTEEGRRVGLMEAIRSLKRRLSDKAFKRMLDDAIAHAMTGPGEQQENDL